MERMRLTREWWRFECEWRKKSRKTEKEGTREEDKFRKLITKQFTYHCLDCNLNFELDFLQCCNGLHLTNVPLRVAVEGGHLRAIKRSSE